MPAYFGPFSPRKFTQPQLFAVLALRQFFKLDYRGTVAGLAEWQDLRNVLGISPEAQYSTLIHAEERLLKMWLAPCSTYRSNRLRAPGCLNELTTRPNSTPATPPAWRPALQDQPPRCLLPQLPPPLLA
jgi:hypothetical protein